MKRIATTLLIASLLAAPTLALPPPASAAVSIGIAVNFAPPAMPVYAQPMAPAPGYLWTPGYWAYDPAYGYYWVPGTWVLPPQPGLLWTPGWWGWSAGLYRWNPGYWGPHVGFYGGINYGYGYYGNGYVGGQWRGSHFYYNRAVNNINVTNIHNVYINRTVVKDIHVNRVSYNGGRGGLTARPTAAQANMARERHFGATSMQARQREMSMRDPGQRFQANQGRPAVFATQHAGRMDSPHTVRSPAAPHTRMVAPQEQRPMEAPRQSRPVEAPRQQQRSMEAPREAYPVEAPRGQRPLPTPRGPGAAQGRSGGNRPPAQQRAPARGDQGRKKPEKRGQDDRGGPGY